MKASRATVEHGLTGGLYVVLGLIITLGGLGNDLSPGLSRFFVGAMIVAAGIVLAFASRALVRVQPAPAEMVEVSTFETFWRRALPAASAGLIFAAMIAIAPMAWVVGVAWAAVGAATLLAAFLVGLTERRRGARVLRCENRYFLAH
jgi:hypothetical protein